MSETLISTNKMRDISREQFEKFALSPDGGLFAGHLAKGEDGEYLNYVAQCYWLFWQASRDAVVVNWPDPHTYTAPDCAGAAILDCRVAFGKAMAARADVTDRRDNQNLTHQASNHSVE